MIARPTTTRLKEMPALTAGTAAVWLAVAVAVSIGAVAQVAAPTPLMAGSEVFCRFHHDPQQRALALLLDQIQQAASKNKMDGKGAVSQASVRGHWAGPLIQSESAMALAMMPDQQWLTDASVGYRQQRQSLACRINRPPPVMG